MSAMPLLEIVAALAVTLIILGLRTLWRGQRGPLAHGTSRGGGLQQRHLDNERKKGRLLASCAAIALMSIPLVLRVVPPNGVYGFRTSLTLSNSAIWYPANAFLGWALLVAAVAGATLLVMLPATAKRWLLWASFLVPVSCAVAASFVYLERLR